MTGIIIDVFKDELFAFADGRVTSDDIILTDEDDKIHKLDANNVVTMVGSASLIEPCLDLIRAGTVGQDTIKGIAGDGEVIWLTKQHITVLSFEPSGHGISKYKIKSAPMFFGSGTVGLQGAYYALMPEIKVSISRDEYLAIIKLVYKAAATRIASMNTLTQTESIKLVKSKVST